MGEVGATLEAIKGFGGYTTSVTLWIFAALTWWKGLPVLIDVLSKAMDSWQNRAASIEERLQASMTLTLDRLQKQLESADKRIAEGETKHEECEERNRKLQRAFDSLRDEFDLIKQDLTGAKRQLATYEARGGEPVPVTGALFLAPNVPPVSRIKGE